MGEPYSASSRAARFYPATPGQHAYVLHPPKARGRVTVARKLPEPAGWEEETWAPWELDAPLHGADGRPDTYMSQNRFRGKRRAIAQVSELCAMFGDLDFYKVPELRGLAPEAVLAEALGLLQGAGIPEPSLAFSSGRGVYVIWAHHPVNRKELPVWNACQDRLHAQLRSLGADPAAKHAATVLRLSGTVKSKNGAVVRSLCEPREEPYRFEGLAEALVKNAADLPEGVEDREAAAVPGIAPQGVTEGVRNHPQGWSEASLWEGRLTDLQHLRRMRYGEDGPMEDFRDRWLFIACTAVSWLVGLEALEVEVLALAEEAGGWDPRRTRSDLSAYVELRRRRLRGDPDREARELSARLEKLERRRSNLIDMGADGTIGREDLRTKLEEADEERDSLRRALREAAGRGRELERLSREREVLADRFSAMRGMGLRHLAPQDRRAVYDALRVTAHADGRGDVRITGVFDADITELLPASWALAKASAREYDAGRNVGLPTPHKGVVTVDHSRPGT